MPLDPAVIGATIRTRRLEAALTQADLAERLNVSRYTVYKYMHELEELEKAGEHLQD